jgi:hypothetical protein
MKIRKISIGTDPMKAMHFQLGSRVMGDSHTVHAIEEFEEGFRIWIVNDINEVMVWKTVNKNMPFIVEHNLDY